MRKPLSRNAKTEKFEMVANVAAGCVLVCLAIVLLWGFHILYQAGKIDPSNPDIRSQIIMNGWMNQEQ